jgi:succinate dehydrogenase/fumarate reductase-like Fe-S protein
MTMRETVKNINVKVLRSKPWTEEKSTFVTYQVPIEGKASVLNVLTYITENVDPTLGFYCSCRIGKCLGCSVVVNGEVKLACTTLVVSDITVEPLKKSKVIKDLVTEKKGKSRSRSA